MVSGISSTSTLSTEMLQKMQQEMFNRVDENGDEAIDKTEFETMINKMAEETGMEVDVEARFDELDANGDGQLDQEEFDAGGPPPPPPPPNADQLSSLSTYGSDGQLNQDTDLQTLLELLSEQDAESISYEPVDYVA